jgi:hypothetical protein
MLKHNYVLILLLSHPMDPFGCCKKNNLKSDHNLDAGNYFFNIKYNFVCSCKSDLREDSLSELVHYLHHTFLIFETCKSITLLLPSWHKIPYPHTPDDRTQGTPYKHEIPYLSGQKWWPVSPSPVRSPSPPNTAGIPSKTPLFTAVFHRYKYFRSDAPHL